MPKVIYSTKKNKRYIVQRYSDLFGHEIYTEWYATNFKWRAIWEAWMMYSSTVSKEYRVIDTKETKETKETNA